MEAAARKIIAANIFFRPDADRAKIKPAQIPPRMQPRRTDERGEAAIAISKDAGDRIAGERYWIICLRLRFWLKHRILPYVAAR